MNVIKKNLCIKDSATVDYIVPIMIIMIAMVLILFKIQISTTIEAKLKVEDAMTDADMASAIIDNVDRAATHYVGNRYIENEPDKISNLYNIYINCLVAELNLDNTENLNPQNNTLICSKIDVLEYSIYNYYDDHIAQITYYPTTGSIESELDLPITTKTPNGKDINSYTVYSKIGFSLNNVGFSKWGAWLSKSGRTTQEELNNLDSSIYVTKEDAVGIYKNNIKK